MRIGGRHVTHPSGKAIAITNEERCWGRGSNYLESRAPFHRHGFVTSWGLRMGCSCRGHLLFYPNIGM